MLHDPYWPAERLLWRRHFEKCPPLAVLAMPHSPPEDDDDEDGDDENGAAAIRAMILRNHAGG